MNTNFDLGRILASIKRDALKSYDLKIQLCWEPHIRFFIDLLTAVTKKTVDNLGPNAYETLLSKFLKAYVVLLNEVVNISIEWQLGEEVYTFHMRSRMTSYSEYTPQLKPSLRHIFIKNNLFMQLMSKSVYFQIAPKWTHSITSLAILMALRLLLNTL